MPRQKLPLRVIVEYPLLRAEMKVQVGRDGLLPPVEASVKRLVFEFDADVDLSETAPNFLGKYVHGPKDARFIYINSGSYSGTGDVSIGRRADKRNKNTRIHISWNCKRRRPDLRKR